jgi:hypothetical protein
MVTCKFSEEFCPLDILQCSSLKLSRHFREIYRLHLWARLAACFTLVSCLTSTLKIEVLYSCETSVHPMNGLHGVISQKTGLFVTSVVRTSDPTCNINIYSNCHTSWQTHGPWAVFCLPCWQLKCCSVCQMLQKYSRDKF